MTWLAIGSALWLGILTSISPCPMATNIAAISFIGRRVGSAPQVLLSGLLYVAGRLLAYVGVAVLLLAGLLAVGEASRFLQKYMNQILGPVLILLGMILLNLLGSTVSLNLAGGRVQERATQGGPLWAVALGFLFALSFCPISAGLFFGGLLPLAVQGESRLILPSVFAVGTGLPVVGFAILIAFASNRVGKAFDRLQQIERWVRTATGVIFIVVGVYYCLRHVYGVVIPIPGLT